MRSVSDPKSNRSASEPKPHDPEALVRDGVRTVSGIAPSENVGALLSSARHELRSPLQSIQGFAELLSSESYGSLSEEQQSFVHHIMQGSLELGAAIEACFELAEVELVGRELVPTRVDLRSALIDALDPLRNGSDTIVSAQFAQNLQAMRVRIERESLRRALHALLAAMSTGTHKSFRAELDLAGEHGRLLLTRQDGEQTALVEGEASTTPAGAAPWFSIDELTRRQRSARSLIWLRLSHALLALQDASLLITDQLNRAEVRFRLSSTH